MAGVYGIVVEGRPTAERFTSARRLGRALRRLDDGGLYRCSRCGQLHVGSRWCGPCLLSAGVTPAQVRVPAGLVAPAAFADADEQQTRAFSDDEARAFLDGYGEE